MFMPPRELHRGVMRNDGAYQSWQAILKDYTVEPAEVTKGLIVEALVSSFERDWSSIYRMKGPNVNTEIDYDGGRVIDKGFLRMATTKWSTELFVPDYPAVVIFSSDIRQALVREAGRADRARENLRYTDPYETVRVDLFTKTGGFRLEQYILKRFPFMHSDDGSCWTVDPVFGPATTTPVERYVRGPITIKPRSDTDED